VTVRSLSSLLRTRDPAALRRVVARTLAFAALGVCAALLASCSSSGKGLIPTGDAGPLQSDFEEVAQAAENGDGSCSATERALLKTDQDFARLPNSVDAGLRDTLRRGIENLRTRSLALCTQPLPQAATTQTTPKTTAPTPSPSGPGGGTPAPGEEGSEEEGAAKGHGGAGGSSAGGNGGQEAVK
jgi:hypothetical protein